AKAVRAPPRRSSSHTSHPSHPSHPLPARWAPSWACPPADATRGRDPRTRPADATAGRDQRTATRPIFARTRGREDENAVVSSGAVATLLGGDAGVATAPLEAGIARCLSVLDAAEEGLERPIQPGQHVLQDCEWMAWYSGRTALMAGSRALC